MSRRIFLQWDVSCCNKNNIYYLLHNNIKNIISPFSIRIKKGSKQNMKFGLFLLLIIPTLGSGELICHEVETNVDKNVGSNVGSNVETNVGSNVETNFTQTTITNVAQSNERRGEMKKKPMQKIVSIRVNITEFTSDRYRNTLSIVSSLIWKLLWFLNVK